MAFDSLTDKLTAAFKKLKSKGKLNENDVKEAMREVRLALLEADVNYKVAKDFTNKIVEKSIGTKVMESLTPAQMVIKIVKEELVNLMGEKNQKINFSSKPPTIIMLCGLQGSGKTTHAGKLGLFLKSQGHRPMLVACDIYRPAAIKQLQVIGQKAKLPVFEMGQIEPVKIVKEAIKHAKDYGHDVLIIDTAGRLHIDKTLMGELETLKNKFDPKEILLVVDSMTGQDAVNVAKSFNDQLDLTGVILTKLDGDTRGGAALSVLAVTGKPIKFSGTGEKLGDLEPFHPDRMASRILGMGDVLTLIEEVEAKLDDKKAKELADKLSKNKFDFNDLLEQFKQIKKMGPIKSVLSKIPGLEKQLKNVDIDDRAIDKTIAIIYSMTKKERQNPDILNPSRKRRIAAGSGNKVEDVNKLIKQYEQMKKLFKQFNSKGKRKKRFMPNIPGLTDIPGFATKGGKMPFGF